MEIPKEWEYDVFLFAKDLFSDLMSRHPMFQKLPPIEKDPDQTSNFFEDMGKCVTYTWHILRKIIEPKLSWDFPKFAESQKAFKDYLVSLCNFVFKNANPQPSDESVFSTIGKKVIVFSAILLEQLSFLYRLRVTHFLYSAPFYWQLLFKKFACVEFYKEGGWKALELLTKENSEYYDKNIEEIHYQFWNPEESEATMLNESKIQSPAGSVLASGSTQNYRKMKSSNHTVKECKGRTCLNLSKSSNQQSDKVDMNQEDLLSDTSEKIDINQENLPSSESFEKVYISQDDLSISESFENIDISHEDLSVSESFEKINFNQEDLSACESFEKIQISNTIHISNIKSDGIGEMKVAVSEESSSSI